MTTVYMVTSGQYSGYGVVAVFSTREKAEQYIADFQLNETTFNEIEEADFDPPCRLPRYGLKPYSVHMRMDTGQARATEYGGPLPTGKPMRVDEMLVSWFSDEYVFTNDKTLGLEAHVWAKDKKHAVKIASEYRRHWLASER